MKRYRLINMDYDSRSYMIKVFKEMPKRDDLIQSNYDRLLKDFELTHGVFNFEYKLQNYLDIGAKPFSVFSPLLVFKRSATNNSYPS